MIDNWFRQKLSNKVRLLIKAYAVLGLTPNKISILSFLIALLACWLVIKQAFVLAIAAWWAGRLLDGTDGIFARSTGQATPFGAFLDIVCDMASYSIMIIGFAISFPHLMYDWLFILYLYVLCITGALSLGALEGQSGITKRDNRGLRLGAGLAEGGETGLAYTAFLLFPQHLFFLTKLWIGILLFTVLSRVILAYLELRSR